MYESINVVCGVRVRGLRTDTRTDGRFIYYSMAAVVAQRRRIRALTSFERVRV